MCGARHLNHHAAMMDRMAQSLGVDLNAALSAGLLEADDWKDALIRCTGCGDEEGCMLWLAARHGASEFAPHAPEFCENKSMLKRLCKAQRTVFGAGAETGGGL